MLLERVEAEGKTIQAKSKSGRKAAARSQKPMKRGVTMANLIEVLKSKENWVSASDAAEMLGIGDGATSDAVEGFYDELRVCLQDGHIEVERRGDEDWLRLMSAGWG
jgi:type I restriction enzyme S subunit